jgi:hypothetical protein
MRCANCNIDNPREATKCAGCGAALSRRIKRRSTVEESDSPFGGPIEAPNRAAIWAYRLAILALIPGLGLALGPVALLWGAAAWLRARGDPEFTAQGPVRVAVLLGVLNTLMNWIGLVLVIQGLTAAR